jgi:alpha-galactosidase
MGDRTVIAFVGAGSVVFTKDLVADLLRMSDLGPLELRLHDIDPERLATAEGMTHKVAQQLGVASPSVTTSLERGPAFEGADFVINSIQVGGIDGTRTDFAVPETYGLNQTIADTIGIGGIFRALRTFPVLDGIAQDMLEHCPDAWLLNYTNPMSMNIAYLGERYPDLNLTGMCHSVFWTVMGLCEVIGVPYEEVVYDSAGVNHQAWLLRWERNGESLYPLLDERIATDPDLRRRVRVDMYRRLGYYPTETSEHSSEYLPWYLHHPEEIERLRIPVGDYVGISEENVREYEATKRRLAEGEDFELEETTEYAPQVIHSMVTGAKRRIFVTTPNTDLITNLPRAAGVEVPAFVDELGVQPVHVGDLPPQCAALNRQFLAPALLTVRAAVDGDPAMLRRAAMVDPNTAASLTVDQIWAMVDDLVKAHGDRLPEALRVPLSL